jgi:hypothetical protein
MGTIAGIAAIASFIAAAVMLMLGGLGLVHARRTSPETDILAGRTGSGTTAATPRNGRTNGNGRRSIRDGLTTTTSGADA